MGRPVASRTATPGGVSATALSWIVSDAQGTPTALVRTNTTTADSKTGAVTWQYADPFGAVRGTGAGAGWVNGHGFLNAPTSAMTGLIHLGARDYDPGIGRFISVDPLLEIHDPSQINGYSYAGSDPVSRTDPSGLDGPVHCGTGYSTSCNDSYGSTTGGCYAGNVNLCPATGNGPPAAGVVVPGVTPPVSTPNFSSQVADPSHGGAAYAGVNAKVVTENFAPGIAGGSIHVGIFIPSSEVAGDVGDGRGFDAAFDPSDTRVTIYVDLDAGRIVARQNQSCKYGTNDCKVMTPDVSVRVSGGMLTIKYKAVNAEAESLASLGGFVVNGSINVNLTTGVVHGNRSNYPSLEAYSYDSRANNTSNVNVQQKAGGLTPTITLFPGTLYTPGIQAPGIPFGLKKNSSY